MSDIFLNHFSPFSLRENLSVKLIWFGLASQVTPRDPPVVRTELQVNCHTPYPRTHKGSRDLNPWLLLAGQACNH